MKIRRSEERGAADHGWLQSKHTFSFADYYDPEHMGFKTLRVINEDYIAGGQGFGTHGHRDMEIITVMLEGSLAHKDSMGHAEVIRPGEVQVMTAGRGVEHSEYNASKSETAHLLQIWIMPERRGLKPSYDQKKFDRESRLNKFQRVAGPDRGTADEALRINQDADVFLLRLEPGRTVQYDLANGRGAWLQVADGQVSVNDSVLNSGDAAALETPGVITLQAKGETAEIVMFDLK